jgi:pyruvate formate lyase activating enzyme
VTGVVWDLKKYALHDGPGIRTLVFFKGCPLHCPWCCNPESQSFEPRVSWLREACIGCGACLAGCLPGAISVAADGAREIDPARCDVCGLCVKACPGQAMQQVGRRMTVAEVLREVMQDSAFYARSGGGLTLSGGEPTAQPEFAAALLRTYKVEERGASTALETCGYCDWLQLERILDYTDLVLFDIKLMDSGRHRRLTGVGNEVILQNARRVVFAGKRLVVRVPLIPGFTDSDDNVGRIAEFAADLPNVEELHLLPYHRLGEAKYARLGRRYCLQGAVALPAERVAELQALVERTGLRVKVGG